MRFMKTCTSTNTRSAEFSGSGYTSMHAILLMSCIRNILLLISCKTTASKISPHKFSSCSVL